AGDQPADGPTGSESAAADEILTGERAAIGDRPDGSSEPEDAGTLNGGVTETSYTENIFDLFKNIPIPPPKIFIVNGINDNTATGIGGFTQEMISNLIDAGYPIEQLEATSQIYAPWHSSLAEKYSVDLTGTNLSSSSPYSDTALITDLTTNLAASSINWLVNGTLNLTDNSLNNIFQSEIGKPLTGAYEVMQEYLAGEDGYYSTMLYNDIEQKLKNDPLLPGQSIILLGHSGGGAPITNIAPKLEDNLGVNVSGLVTVGSPVANYDYVDYHVETIVQIRHEDDLIGIPFIRSDETRDRVIEINDNYNDLISTINPFHVDGSQGNLGLWAITRDILKRDADYIDVITSNSTGPQDQDPFAAILNGHGSYDEPNNTEIREVLNENFDLGLSTKDLSESEK
ncbi:MAG: hypothetical protein AAF633_16920, partial [Chloroflexota bacterium]